MADLLTPRTIRDLLTRHGLAPRRRLGQHFLTDPNTVRRIVRLADVRPGETILEIGPGLGSLTLALAAAAGRVVAVESDPRVAEVLGEVVAGSGVDVVVGDALRIDLGALVGPRARLVANLPYNVATPIVATVLDDVPAVTGGLVMVQRELGERWTAPAGSKAYGAISVKVAYHARSRIVGDVPATVFWPPPKVSSVLVAFERRERPPVDVADARRFLDFVAASFAHRRKTLANALGAAGVGRDDAVRAMRAAGLEGRTRAEQVDLAGFAVLWTALGGTA